MGFFVLEWGVLHPSAVFGREQESASENKASKLRAKPASSSHADANTSSTCLLFLQAPLGTNQATALVE